RTDNRIGEPSMTRALVVASAVAALSTAVVAQEVNFQPAIYRAGTLPTLPNTAVGGGEVLLDASVDVRGIVTSVTELRVTPPFTQMFADAVRGWTFRPARDFEVPVASPVLVAALVRPPALTLPSTLGEPARDVAVPRPDVPVPITLITPAQPPHALRSGVVL